MAEQMSKPQCGGGASADEEYDLPLHVAAVFLVLGASCFGAGFPVMAKKIRWLRIPPKVFFFCKHFGTGVLIATAFVHLLPTAFLSLSNPCLPDLFIKDYPPLPGVIMMAALFILFVVEVWLNDKTGGHTHGGPTGSHIVPAPAHCDPALLANTPPHPPFGRADSFNTEHTLYNNNESTTYPNDKISTLVQEKEYGSAAPSIKPSLTHTTSFPTTITDPHDPECGPVDPLVLRKMSLNITLLEGGILFHSIFVGMTVSITTTGFVVLLVAILFHQMFEGLGLGSRIAAVPYPKGSWRPWILVVAFGTTAPIGQAIGLASRGAYDPDSAFGLIIVGVFNAISSGLLIYASCVDLLAEDFLSEEAKELTKKDKITAFIYVLLGAIGMSVVGAFA